jgi:hypothetical protein
LTVWDGERKKGVTLRFFDMMNLGEMVTFIKIERLKKEIRKEKSRILIWGPRNGSSCRVPAL